MIGMFGSVVTRWSRST